VPEPFALYHRLPHGAKTAVAGVRGVQLSRRRYDRRTDARVARALRRDAWTADDWARWQRDRLTGVLAHARHGVPWYRAADLPRPGAPLTDWPVLPKAAVRAHGAELVADTPGRGAVHEHTSGSTGTPLTIVLDREAVREWYALIEARLRRWNGVTRHDAWAMLGGQLVVRPGGDGPFWVRNAAMHQLYLSALDISERNAPAYAAAMVEHSVRYLHGYPSAMHALAVAIERSGAPAPKLQVAISNAEPLLDHQRAAIGRVFGCPVRDTYGMTEIVAGGSECHAGRLHVWPEVGIVEVLDDDDRPVPAGVTGRLVCTGLLNRAMPLIRYEVGDRGALATEPCPCGRGAPVLAEVEGRIDDVVTTADGRSVGRLDHVFKADLPVVEAQIVQHEVGRFSIRVVPAPGWDAGHADALAARLVQRVGPATVSVVEVPALERGANGKLRSVVSELPAAAVVGGGASGR
jgi:phenylacetate-CoA ligase